MKLTTARIITLILILSAVVLLAFSGCSTGGSDASRNKAPVADAGVDQHVKEGDKVTLDGSGSSDADHDQLLYDWSMTRPPGSTATLNGDDTSHPTFTADEEGDYVIKLIVNDGHFDSAKDSVTVTATHDLHNAKPVAVATVDNPHPKTGSLVKLDGSGSHDADLNPPDTLTYHWTITAWPSGSTNLISDDTAVTPTFIPDVDGDYTIELIVNDGHENSLAVTVTVTATHDDINAKPVADAGPDQSDAKIGKEVTLDGSKSHDNDIGDTLTYSWTIQSWPSGDSTVTLTDATTMHPTFIPDLWGPYVFKLIVNDGQVDSDPSTVTVHATPACGLPDSACIFVTSLSYDGDLKTAGSGSDGIIGANNICNNHAAYINFPGTYMAWISTDNPDRFVIDRIFHSTVPYKMPGGQQIADDFGDLIDGTIDHPINISATNRPVSQDQEVWTSTYTNGHSSGDDCTDHTEGSSGTGIMGRIGHAQHMDKRWTDTGIRQCAATLALYCLQQPQP